MRGTEEERIGGGDARRGSKERGEIRSVMPRFLDIGMGVCDGFSFVFWLLPWFLRVCDEEGIRGCEQWLCVSSM